MNAFALIASGNLKKARQYQQALQAAGFQVQVVTTGARAQVQLAFTSPDLILLDANLPDLPAEIIIRQINAHRRLDLSVLFLISSDGSFSGDSGRLLTYTFAQAVDPVVLASLASEVCALGAQVD